MSARLGVSSAPPPRGTAACPPQPPDLSFGNDARARTQMCESVRRVAAHVRGRVHGARASDGVPCSRETASHPPIVHAAANRSGLSSAAAVHAAAMHRSPSARAATRARAPAATSQTPANAKEPRHFLRYYGHTQRHARQVLVQMWRWSAHTRRRCRSAAAKAGGPRASAASAHSPENTKLPKAPDGAAVVNGRSRSIASRRHGSAVRCESAGPCGAAALQACTSYDVVCFRLHALCCMMSRAGCMLARRMLRCTRMSTRVYCWLCCLRLCLPAFVVARSWLVQHR